MSAFATDEQWQSHLLNGGVFLDVRAPIEYSEGSVPGSMCLPLLTDDERHQVGLTYKEEGPDAAIKLGHSLVSGPTRAARIESWAHLAKTHPDLILYCFRGGQRSQISQAWLSEANIRVPRIQGGYKATRNQFLSWLDECSKLPLICLSGHTGSGKTRILKRHKAETPSITVIDLEGLAHHRGSAYGNELDPQPSQVNFENQLALEIHRAHLLRKKTVWMEDEARTIGKMTLPDSVFLPLRQCPLVVIDEAQDVRAQVILEEYVIDAIAELRRRMPEHLAWQTLRSRLTDPIHKISRKLGGARAQEALRLIETALVESEQSEKWSAHLPWIEFLLENYYDPFYSKHMERQKHRIVAKVPGVFFDSLSNIESLQT